MANRIVVMNEGRAEQIGTPLEVYARPASTFVAGFIGSRAMNRLPARSEGAGLKLDGADTVISWPSDMGRPSGDVMLGIRPEDLRLESNGIPIGTLSMD